MLVDYGRCGHDVWKHAVAVSYGIDDLEDLSTSTGTCTDTSGWANPHGFDCAKYASKGWCQNGGAVAGMEWTLGATFGHPEQNCCVCGKPHIPSPPTPPPTPSVEE